MARGVRPTTNSKALAQQRRQSDAGRQERHMYNIQPQNEMRRKMYRDAHRKAKGLI